jgi:hypothetical protein
MIKKVKGSFSDLKLSAFLKSKKGGISYLVFEVIISVIILSLLVVVIYIFRNNMDIIGNSATKVNATDKIKAELMLPLDKNIVSGSEVVSVLRYYSKDSTVKIEVKLGETVKTYIGENYNPLTFSINYEDSFQSEYQYEGNNLKTIKYSKI